MASILTREGIEAAFEFVGQTAADRGVVLEIAVFGGSCLILASDIRDASGDVDAIFRSDRSIIREICALAAKRFQMPEDWLNKGVRKFAPPIGNPEPTLLPFGDYPNNGATGVGLRVLLPTPEYMLAMKILSYRLDEETDKIQTDQSDAVALMKLTGKTTTDDLMDLVKLCYPSIPGILMDSKPGPRIKARIETLTDAYAADKDDSLPTWNAGRGPPVADRKT
jgi:hypothetical protein